MKMTPILIISEIDDKYKLKLLTKDLEISKLIKKKFDNIIYHIK